MLLPWVEKEGVNTIVLATVPVCNRTCGPWPVKIASVLLAGIRNCTVRPPVENCTAGSTGKSLETLIVNVPATASGYGLDRLSRTAGCDCGSERPLGPCKV